MAVARVPYGNFIKLQFVLGGTEGNVTSAAVDAEVPCPSLSELTVVKDELFDSLPAQAKAGETSLSRNLVEKHYEALSTSEWPGAGPLVQFLLKRKEFEKALEMFSSPELRVRADCLILTGQLDPKRISEILQQWSRHSLSAEVLELYAYFFCNVDCMSKFDDWMRYIEKVRNDRHRWFLAQAYDTHSRADLTVLLSDLSIRASIDLAPEDAVRDLMMSAFVNTKKEERKVNAGVRAKNTAVFEWSGMFCSMYDRVQKALEGGDRDNVLESLRISLVQVKDSGTKKISDYQVTTGDVGQ